MMGSKAWGFLPLPGLIDRTSSHEDHFSLWQVHQPPTAMLYSPRPPLCNATAFLDGWTTDSRPTDHYSLSTCTTLNCYNSNSFGTVSSIFLDVGLDNFEATKSPKLYGIQKSLLNISFSQLSFQYYAAFNWKSYLLSSHMTMMWPEEKERVSLPNTQIHSIITVNWSVFCRMQLRKEGRRTESSSGIFVLSRTTTEIRLNTRN